MICGKTENNSFNKIHRRTLRLIYELEDATFEDLLEMDESKSFHGNNIHINFEIYKSTHQIGLPIKRNFLDLKVDHYNLRSTVEVTCPKYFPT